MELGALICTPRSPDCAACPVANHCYARRMNRVEDFPRPKLRAAVTSRRFIALIVERDGKFLVRQRPDGAVNAHLWEFPQVEAGARLSPAAALPADQCASERPTVPICKALRLGQPRSGNPSSHRAVSGELLCTIKHSITRYRITTEAWRIAASALPAHITGLWRSRAQLAKLPLTSAHRRIASRILRTGHQEPV